MRKETLEPKIPERTPKCHIWLKKSEAENKQAGEKVRPLCQVEGERGSPWEDRQLLFLHKELWSEEIQEHFL